MRAFSRISLVLAGVLLAAGCGGGGGGGGTPPPPAPAGLTYASPTSTYESDVAIAPNLPTVGGGPVDLWTVLPALPAGLALDPATGVVSGMPTTPVGEADYVVTASNDGGSAQATLSVEVFLNRALDMSAKTSFTDEEIRYFLGRTHFGGTAAEFATVKAMGLPAYVDQMVQFADTTALETAAAGMLLRTDDPVGLEGQFPGQEQVARYWLHLMLANPNPFQEVLAFFWHDHFAASSINLEQSATRWMVDQTNLWRKEGNGNLRTLLLRMARDNVMLVWLDGVLNVDGGPNENFAREFWELFTLKVDEGYTQADIVQAAKAFTGYRRRFKSDGSGLEEIVFSPSRHDHSQKTIFGQYVIPAQTAGAGEHDDFQDMVDITVDHRPVAENIAQRMFDYFCYPGPTSTLPYDTMAATLRGASYELKPMLAQLFKSEAFFSSRARQGIAKNPVEHLVGFCRTTGLVPIDNKAMEAPAGTPQNELRTLDADLVNLTQRPTQPPSVNGWPIGSDWLSAQNMLDRANAVLNCIRDRTDQTNAGVSVSALLPPAVSPGDDANVVDGLAALLHVALTPTERTSLIDYLNSQAGAGGVPTPSPFDRTNATHISERVRGLLYVLAQHPTYGVR